MKPNDFPANPPQSSASSTLVRPDRFNGAQAATSGAAKPAAPGSSSRTRPLPLGEFLANSTNPARRRPVVSRRRIQFDCPACRRWTLLPLRYGGQKVSCPLCYTGIRVPDPRRRLPGQNLGRTMEPLLRPQDFASVSGEARPMTEKGSKGSAARWMAAVGSVLLLVGMAGMTPATVAWAARDRKPSDFPAMGSLGRPSSPSPDRTGEARAIVGRFLNAATPEAKADCVTDPAAMVPLLTDWYARRPGGGAQPGAVITAVSEGFSARPGDPLTVSEVTVETPDAPTITYLVEHHRQGPRIAWAESVGYSPVEWSELLRQGTRQDPVPVRVRVLACRDDYFNNTFTREADFCCVRLHDPLTMEQLGFGYLPRTAAIAQSLAATLPGASRSLLRPVTVEVLPQPDSVRTRQVRITGPVMPGWKEATDAGALAQR